MVFLREPAVLKLFGVSALGKKRKKKFSLSFADHGTELKNLWDHFTLSQKFFFYFVNLVAQIYQFWFVQLILNSLFIFVAKIVIRRAGSRKMKL